MIDDACGGQGSRGVVYGYEFWGGWEFREVSQAEEDALPALSSAWYKSEAFCRDDVG